MSVFDNSFVKQENNSSTKKSQAIDGISVNTYTYTKDVGKNIFSKTEEPENVFTAMKTQDEQIQQEMEIINKQEEIVDFTPKKSQFSRFNTNEIDIDQIPSINATPRQTIDVAKTPEIFNLVDAKQNKMDTIPQSSTVKFPSKQVKTPDANQIQQNPAQKYGLTKKLSRQQTKHYKRQLSQSSFQ